MSPWRGFLRAFSFGGTIGPISRNDTIYLDSDTVSNGLSIRERCRGLDPTCRLGASRFLRRIRGRAYVDDDG